MNTDKEFSLQETDTFAYDMVLHKKSGQKKIIKKIAAFLRELKTCPTTGTGQVEPLSNYGVRSVWSRRIDKKHRLIYEVFEEEKIVKLLSAWGHYNDK